MGSHLKSHKKQENDLSIENNDNNKDNKIENNYENDNNNKDNKIENNFENDNNNNNDNKKDEIEESKKDNNGENNDVKDIDNIDKKMYDEIINNISIKSSIEEYRDIKMLLDEDYPIKKYENFCKDLIFIKDKKVIIKVNQKFAAEFCRNFTIAPNYQSDFPVIKSKDESIELIDT